MNLLDISFKRVKKNKKNLYYLFLILFLNIILLLVLAFSTNFLEFVNNTITKNIGFRSLDVLLDDKDLDRVRNIDGVVDVHSSFYDASGVVSSFKNDYFDGNISLNYGSHNTLPLNIVGDSFDDEDSGVAICPIYFFPDTFANNLVYETKNKLNGYDLLNTTFDVKYYSYINYGNSFEKDKEYTKTFKIIGLYNSNDLVIPSNTCYVPFKDIKDINDKFLDNTSTYSYIVVVDKNSNVDKVTDSLKSMGYLDATKRMHVDTSITNTITIASIIVLFIIILIIFILTISLIKKKSINESKYIGILKALGYDNKRIIILYTLEIFLLNLFAFLISLIIFLIIYYILKNTLFASLIYSGFKIKLFLKIYFVSILSTIIIPSIVAIYFYYRLVFKGIVNLIRS